MAQLHELLAVEGDLSNVSNKTTKKTTTTFTKKPEHFRGIVRSVTMLDVAREGENVTEEKAMVTTVSDKLEYVAKGVADYFDAMLQKEASNQLATADLVVNGVTIAVALPATFLLGMETRLKNLRAVYEAIPTLDPGIKWEAADYIAPGVFISDPKVSFKTEKTIKSKILVEPTDKHPAQVREWTEDVAVGRIETTQQSGMLTVARKSELLERIDNLIRGVKKARQRANRQEVVDVHIGEKLMSYILE
jgi:hypothetical protein